MNAKELYNMLIVHKEKYTRENGLLPPTLKIEISFNQIVILGSYRWTKLQQDLTALVVYYLDWNYDCAWQQDANNDFTLILTQHFRKDKKIQSFIKKIEKKRRR